MTPTPPESTDNTAPSANKRQGWALGVVMFSMGACGLAYEYTFSKVASDLLGNSVQQWAIIIAIMLFTMGVGADLQKHLKNKGLADKLIGSQLLLGLLGAFGPLAMIQIFAWYPSHFALIQYGFTGLVGLLIGFEIPLILRLNEHPDSDVRFNIARILKMDYIGALLGALVWVFVLIQFFSITQIAFIVALITFGTAAFCTYLFWSTLRWRNLLAGALGVATLATAFGLTQASVWAKAAEQALYRDTIAFSHTTPYQHIVLTEGLNGRVNCYINGHIQFSSEDEHIYHENLVHPAMTLAPRRDRVLILGGGDGLALREVLKYPDVQEVVLVDIDPEMTRLAAENPHLRRMNQDSLRDARVRTLNNEALGASEPVAVNVVKQGLRYDQSVSQNVDVQVYNLDAAGFVRQAPGRFNVIIMDFPDPNSPDLAKLYSLPFYEMMKQKLTADGLFAQQSTSPIHAKEAFLCIGRTMQAAGLAALPYHDNVPSFGEWGWWLGGNARLYDDARLRNMVGGNTEMNEQTRYLTPEMMRAAFIFGKGQLDSEQDAITTLTSSTIYKLYLKAWENAL